MPNPLKLWDSIAGSYDGLRPDQGLTDPRTRDAWAALLSGLLPSGRARILDLGCGTGSLSLLLSALGHDVSGIDFSPAMVATARAKAVAAGVAVPFLVGDAAAPDIAANSVDVIVCRQTLWALPDPRAALRHWATLLRDGGLVILVEGRFASGRGLSEAELLAIFPDTMTAPRLTDLSAEPDLWGGPISDQRLLVVAQRRPFAKPGD